MTKCLICERVKLAQEGKNPYLIHEFKHSYMVLGDHQYYKGYCVLALKEHIRELHELDTEQQREMFEELMRAGQAVYEAFQPWKMNYSCYGNQVPHIHWHIFPRYESDPDHLKQPWYHSAEFDKHPTTDAEKSEHIRLVQSKLDL
jgi:diadenosine tetraphosphate (Ap4A) HIT family hydrolase